MWRALCVAFLCTVLCATRAFAHGSAIIADFDGDGRHDRVSLDASEPSIVRIWLSATRTTQIIRSSQPLQSVTAVDLNNDRRAELVATTQSSGLHVWTKARAGFRAYHRKRTAPRTLGHPERRRVDDRDEDTAAALGAAKPIPPSAAAAFHRRGPPPAVRHDARELIAAIRSALPLAPSSPRPPPLR